VADTDTYTEGGMTDGGWTTATSDAGVDETCAALPSPSLPPCSKQGNTPRSLGTIPTSGIQ
jgi:hypothetical protein